MTQQTPQENLSLILLPGGEVGEDCLNVARAWASEGLLKRALWIPASRVQRSEYGMPLAGGYLLDQDQESLVDVLAVLAQSRLHLVTLVVLQVPQPGDNVDEEQLSSAALLMTCLENSRPSTLDPSAEKPVDFVLLNLLAGPTGMSGVPSGHVLSRRFAANLLAAPEDRRAADQMDRFVRPGGNLVPWAVAQAAGIAGVWSGIDEGPWRLLAKWGVTDDSALSQGDFVVPVRGFARIVTSAPTARRALALAMDEIRHEPGNALVSDHIVPLTDPSHILNRILDAFDDVDGGRLRYQSPAVTPEPGKARQGFMAATGQFVSFSAREILRVPGYAYQRFSAKMSTRATKALSGDEGHEEVTFAGLPPDLAYFNEDFERQALQAQRNLGDIQTGLPPASPELWRTLRQTVFGLLDGSPIPEPIPTPIVADQRVVMPSTTIVVPPPYPWAPSVQDADEEAETVGLGDLFVEACSPWQAQYAREEMAARLAAAVPAQQTDKEPTNPPAVVLSAEEQAAPVAEHATTLEQERVCAQCGEPLANEMAFCPGCGTDLTVEAGSDAREGVGEAADDEAGRTGLYVEEETKQPPVVNDTKRDDRHAASLDRQAASLEAWIRDREQSLTWRLALRIYERTLQAGSDRQAAYNEAVTVPTIDGDEPRRARNQFANRFMLWFGVGLLIVSLTARFGNALARLISVPSWLVWVVIVAILVLWLVIVLTSYYRRRSRFLATLNRLRHRQRDAQRRCQESAYAENKLKGLYQQIVEWGEILGYGVHDPWQPDQSWYSGMPDQDMAATLPTCVDVAVPDPNDARGNRLLRRAAMRSIASEGWRARTFNLLLDLALAERAPETTDSESLQTDVNLLDLDAPATPNGSRRLMLDALRSSALQPEAARHVLRKKAAGLYAERETLMRHAVVAVNSEIAGEDTDLLATSGGLQMLRPTWGDFITGIHQGATQFSLEMWSDIGRADGDTRRAVKSIVWTPPGLESVEDSSGVHEVHSTPADRNRGIDVSVRIDLGPATETHVLRLFSDDPMGPAAELPFSTAAEPMKSSPRDDVTPVEMDATFYN